MTIFFWFIFFPKRMEWNGTAVGYGSTSFGEYNNRIEENDSGSTDYVTALEMRRVRHESGRLGLQRLCYARGREAEGAEGATSNDAEKCA